MLRFVTSSLDEQIDPQKVVADRADSPKHRVLVIVPAFQEEASVGNVVRQIRLLSSGSNQSQTAVSLTGTPEVSPSATSTSATSTSATASKRGSEIGSRSHDTFDTSANTPTRAGGAGFTLDVLVVDDGSTDDTAAHAQSEGASVASLPVNLGVGAALQTGFRYAVKHGYTTVVTIDADGQHPVSHIPALLGVSGVALVVGSRFVPGSVAPEWVSSTRSAAMGVLRMRLTARTGVRLYDPTSGFRVIREPLLTRFALDFPATYLGDTFEAHLSAAAVLGADQIAEVSVPMKARATGVPSSVGLRNLAYFARALLTTSRLVWKPLGSDARFPEPARRLEEPTNHSDDEIGRSAFDEPVTVGSNPLGGSGMGVDSRLRSSTTAAPSTVGKGSRA